MELRDRGEAPEDFARVRCDGCGRELDEDVAQAQRWGYWAPGAAAVYPYCPDCAARQWQLVPGDELE